MKNIENNCYWYEYYQNKSKGMTLREGLKDEELSKCYTCRDPEERCCYFDKRGLE